MNTWLDKLQFTQIFKKALSTFIIFVFSLSQIFCVYPSKIHAQSVLDLPQPGTMISKSPAFTPAIITGITIYPHNPLKFDFIIDTGDDNLQGEALQKESEKLIKYFMAALTVPENEMWVNLSPYEKNRIIADGLGYTEMGIDMLAQDYILKQLSASLMYPEDKTGEEFWKRVYAKAQAKYGTTEIPLNIFNKIWIVPDRAAIYVNNTSAFIVKSHLKVMLESDYLALESNLGHTDHGIGTLPEDKVNEIRRGAAEVVRDVLIPEVEREINEGKNFSTLRQIFHSMILAAWYKQNFKQGLLGQVYVDQNKVLGIDIEDKQSKQKIYDQYVEAYKKGVYDFIKEDYDEATRQMIPRKYFSGGFDARKKELDLVPDADGAFRVGSHTVIEAVELIEVNATDPAMRQSGRGLTEDQKNVERMVRPIEEAPFDIDEVDNYFLDLDGVVLNTLPINREAFMFIYAMMKSGVKDPEGFEPTAEILEQGRNFFNANIGTLMTGNLRILLQQWSEEGVLKITEPVDDLYGHYRGLHDERRNGVFKEILSGSVEEVEAKLMMPGVREFLEAKKKEEKKIYLVTVSIKKNRIQILEKLGLVEYFEEMIFIGGIQEKIDTVISVMERDGIPEGGALFVDDAPLVVETMRGVLRTRKISGQKGYLIVGLPHSAVDFETMNPDADHLVSNLSGLNKGSAILGDDVGGIDFNPNILDLKVGGNTQGIQFSLPQQPIQNMNINGFAPVIINITPVSNFSLLLGMADQNEGTDSEDYDSTLDPFYSKDRLKTKSSDQVSLLN